MEEVQEALSGTARSRPRWSVNRRKVRADARASASSY